MNKAEERALEAYPPKMRYVGIDSVKDDRKIDVNKPMRDRFVKAYLQAEKDIALTVGDIYDIIRIYEDVLDEIESCENIYIEILKRFNKQKGK